MFKVSTRWGAIPANYSHVKHDQGSNKLAVVFPGRSYTLDGPLMWYNAKSAFAAGCDVIGVEYGYQANRSDLDIDELDYVIDETATALENLVSDQYPSVVFIGKSLGTIVQNKVAKKVSFSVRNHLFLTPLRRIISDVRQSENALVIVGDRDNAFDSSDVDQIAGLPTVKLHVIPDADHGLETEDYRTSIDILKQTATLCDKFCTQLL